MISGASSINKTKTDNYSSYSSVKKEVKEETKKEDVAAVYEKTDEESEKKATYTVTKMTKEERSALIEQLKNDQASRQKQLMDLAQQMLSQQGGNFMIANRSITNLSDEDDSVWKFLASGEYTVDEAAKAKAQELISEDGYYGVKQTSERLFDFASALAGDDEDLMKKMQDAIKDGYKAATKAWGRDLPEISKKTLEATDKLFEDYYASKKETVVES